jgi:hypothetical protein
VQNELKLTQNEPQLNAEMGALCLECELHATSHDLAGATNRKFDRVRSLPGEGIQRTARKYENRGNEAKEYLKTKDITFSNVANSARFVR